MAIIKKTKQNYNTKSKTKSKFNSRKHFSKSNKSGSKTRKVRGGGKMKTKKRVIGRAVSWVGRHIPGSKARQEKRNAAAKVEQIAAMAKARPEYYKTHPSGLNPEYLESQQVRESDKVPANITNKQGRIIGKMNLPPVRMEAGQSRGMPTQVDYATATPSQQSLERVSYV